MSLVVKNLPVDEGDVEIPSWIPESRRSPGEGTGHQSSLLAWKIPWAEGPGGLHLQIAELDTTEVTEHAHHIRLHLLPGKPGPSAEQPSPFNKLAGGDILAEGAGVGHVRSRA